MKTYDVYYYDRYGLPRKETVQAKRRDSAAKIVMKAHDNIQIECVYQVSYNYTSELIANNID